MTIRFDDAWAHALASADEVRRGGSDVVLVRDLIGRVSLVVDGPVPAGAVERFREGTGRFAAPAPILSTHDMFDRTSVLNSPDLHVREARSGDRGSLAVLERSVVGADWTRPDDAPPRKRTTLYGFKGGVGRSTATLVLAEHLAALGHCVLVVDLDLESPGVGALLQHEENLPEHGIIDHLVEAAVGNEDGLDLVSQSQVLLTSGNGEVWVAAAAGRPSPAHDYMAKLNRVYTDLPPGPDGRTRGFGDRLDDAISACEDQVESRSRRPDVVLLDSRAGIHDIAAVAITQLSDLSLLFAADNTHTWTGYGFLFKQWRDNLTPADLDRVRQRLRMVASMVPPAQASSYLEAFRDNAQQCFADFLYDDTTSSDPGSFNFAPGDADAPHSPLPILFTSELVGLNAKRQGDWHSQPLIRAAYESFLATATELITG
ncbi:KGGVGR-motif variant AAA ATPase [Saccharothrix coeruleofusca]|uniref:CobQ/CobB/MinD/ParA nucleotide binding domain-containing protein n=1 Tax=Saccharothrix coeruleofusca TaxID=33919 RepID=A0A918APR8_9PSEU|nr:P-loop NTPase [Saccharothrix coeruleofusca]MBP2339230.1 hypothetical protein [Saccharothrix coeruleofusca]GGP59233.1 hypothetical protein GCM10010185_34690 [Saccharothrix coeruleofusca]